MSLSKKSVYWFYGLYLLIIPLGFFIRILNSKFLTTEQFGLFYSLISFFAILSLITNYGFSTSLRHFIPYYIVKKQKDKIRNLFYYAYLPQILLVIIFSLFLYLFSNQISQGYLGQISFSQYIILFLVFFIGNNFLASLLDIFVSYGLNVYYQLIYMIQQLSILVLTYLVFTTNIFGDSLGGVILVWGITVLLIFLIYVIILFKKFPYLLRLPTFDLNLLKKLFSYSSNVFFSNLGLSILTQIDLVMITYFLTLKDVAYYSNAQSLINIVIMFFTSITVILMSYFSKLYSEKNMAELKFFFKKIYSLLIYFTLPFIMVLFLFSKEILSIIFGQEYGNAALFLKIFSIFTIIRVLYTYNITFLNAINKTNITRNIIIFVLFFNIMLNYIFLIYFGVLGIVCATVISWTIIFIYTLIRLKSFLDVVLDLKELFLIIIDISIFLILVYTLKSIFSIFPLLVNGFISLSLTSIVYVILGRIFSIYDSKDIKLFLPQRYHKYVDKFNFLKSKQDKEEI
ncbi:MAG: flippase [Candidatus Woesearchaeota archaeon]